MDNFWHWFVIAGTLLSLAAVMWLLVVNRKTEGETTGHEWDGISEYDNPLPLWWVWMFVGTTIFALGYLAIFPGLGNFNGTTEWSSANQHDADIATHEARFAPLYQQLASLPAAELIDNPQGMQVGRRLFLNNCATCHGINGKGSVGFPNLTDSEWIWGGDLASISHSILHGRQAQMPAWRPALGDTGVTNVSHYVLSLSGAEHEAELAAAGEAQFQMLCVACHGPAGKGNPALGAPDLTNDIWLYGGDLVDIAETIAAGREGHMPEHTTLIGQDRATILAAYVLSLKSEPTE